MNRKETRKPRPTAVMMWPEDKERLNEVLRRGKYVTKVNALHECIAHELERLNSPTPLTSSSQAAPVVPE